MRSEPSRASRHSQQNHELARTNAFLLMHNRRLQDDIFRLRAENLALREQLLLSRRQQDVQLRHEPDKEPEPEPEPEPDSDRSPPPVHDTPVKTCYTANTLSKSIMSAEGSRVNVPAQTAEITEAATEPVCSVRTRTSNRRRATNKTYTLPRLNQKLRKGDPYTFGYAPKQKEKRMS